MKILEQSEEEYTSKNGVSCKIQKLKIKPPIPLDIATPMSIGIDPGTKNMGIAVLDKIAYLFQLTIDRPKDPVERMYAIYDFISHCVNWFEYNTMLSIEGVSYGSRFREAELSEVRATAVWWGVKWGMKTTIKPPKSIRKVVFGDGKIKPQDEWDDLPPDAANALACAYYPLMS